MNKVHTFFLNYSFSFLISASTFGIDSTTSVVFTNPDTSTLESTKSTSIMSEIPSQETTTMPSTPSTTTEPTTMESTNPTTMEPTTESSTFETAETTVNTLSTVSTASPDTVCAVPQNNNNNNYLPSYSTTTNNQILFRYEFFECDQDYAMCLSMVFNCNNQKVTTKNAKLRKRSRCSFVGEFEDQACISVSSENCTDSGMPMKDWILQVS